MAVKSEYIFDCGKITILRPDVFLIEYSNRRSVEIECIEATRDLRKSIIGEKAYYPIIDMRKGFVSFTKEAKEWVAKNKESSKIRQMDVFIVSNWGMKMEVAFYLKFQKPIVKTKVVTSIEQALTEIDIHKNEQVEM